MKKLANPGEIRQVTTIKARLKKESKEPHPLFVLTPPPFEEIDAAPNKIVTTTAKPTSWELPPWPTLDPPLPTDATEVEKQLYESRQAEGDRPEVWPELHSPGGSQNEPSRLLRPRVVTLEEQFIYRIKEIPEPFSVRRYFDVEGIFVELAAYGGTTSFKAEEAFRAIKEAATRQTPLDGVGEEAFLTRLEIAKEKEDPNLLPFADVAVEGEAKPELLDSGQAVALSAPAFQEIAVKDLEGRKVTFTDPHKKYVSQHPEIERSLLVLVAFFPDQALTVSFAVDERLGSIQDLIALALMSQRKLKTEIRPKS